ncbi:ribonucleoside-triphosphate reductase [Patescibacteria group bacterium]|nr:ribonucleoside-triphosphate reductase [Patescibacteria group bacterium]
MLKTDKTSKKTQADVEIKEKVDTPKKTSSISNSYVEFVPKINKRNGEIVDFDFEKISNAIQKAMIVGKEGSRKEAELVAHKVVGDMVRIAKKYRNFLPTVEGAQDEVERQLILSDYVATAKCFILYRDRRAKMRELGIVVPEKIKQLSEKSAKYFKNNPLGEFVYLRTYSRWIENEGRRETWIETVDRYMDFMKENLKNKLTKKEYIEVRQAILNHEAMPSMRLLQFAGDPARRCNVVAYNCSFIAPSKLEDFAEIMYISMSGGGVGWSAESQNVQALPQIKKQTGEMLPTFVVADTKEGWCDALTFGIKTWFAGKDVTFDYSQLRPDGARLRTMGGRSSGYEPLETLLGFVRTKVLARQGRRLTNINAHDLICKIGEVVVAGGVRRTAMISLSDLDDQEIRHAKDGQFYYTDPQRSVANNSAVYEQKPTNEEFMDEWVALMKGKTGERGIFNRGGLEKTLPERRVKLLKNKYEGTLAYGSPIGNPGVNPCGEIILQSKQFCNLSEVVARSHDTEKTLMKKVRIATILGTYQASLTNFGYLSKGWKQNCEAEALLGVSITGQWDNSVVREPQVLEKLKKEAARINKQYAKRFNINASTCITCVKPSGNLSQTVNCSSGLHPRFAPYYIRRVRISATDSLFKMLKDQGVPYHPEVGQGQDNATTYVVEFPVQSPKSSKFKDDMSALEQLEYWKKLKVHYTEHNPSATIYIGDNEWVAVANWLYENWDIIGGLSFLPRTNHVYKLAPYEEITKEQYEEMVKRFENVDYSKLVTYELHDETEMKRELACAGDTCEII